MLMTLFCSGRLPCLEHPVSLGFLEFLVPLAPLVALERRLYLVNPVHQYCPVALALRLPLVHRLPLELPDFPEHRSNLDFPAIPESLGSPVTLERLVCLDFLADPVFQQLKQSKK